jgi:protein gp37
MEQRVVSLSTLVGVIEKVDSTATCTIIGGNSFSLRRFIDTKFIKNRVIRKICPEEDTKGKFHQIWD